MPHLRYTYLAAIMTVSLLSSIPMVRAQDGFNLRLFDTGTQALCLDGTRAGYYIRPGSGAMASTWIIELEGGGKYNENHVQSAATLIMYCTCIYTVNGVPTPLLIVSVTVSLTHVFLLNNKFFVASSLLLP